ncbi:MAG: FAD-binding oxidoreductase [Acidimicrobiia bacterium]|nr:FAD-binding oxidoreductase [Acidimicrobiia bacterium]
MLWSRSANEHDIATHVTVVGGGIAGISAAAYLSKRARVTVLDMESTLTYHTTGRSAALFAQSYGSPETRSLTQASEAFLMSAAEGIADGPLLTTRGALTVAREDELPVLRAERAVSVTHGTAVSWLDADGVARLMPAIRKGYAVAGLWEPGAHDLDVAALHQAFVRLVRANGGEIATNHPVTALDHRNDHWHVHAADRTIETDVVVNAAGAWGDVVAGFAGVEPVGLTPMRRTAFTVPGRANSRHWPMIIDAGRGWYVRPDGQQFLCSPADETPSEPCDARPREADVALAIERINEATTLEIRSVRSQWAGLRTFAPDRAPVTGFDPSAEGFFWLVGQGGTGIQTSPAAGRLAAALILDGGPPPDLVMAGVDVDGLSPARFASD